MRVEKPKLNFKTAIQLLFLEKSKENHFRRKWFSKSFWKEFEKSFLTKRFSQDAFLKIF
jgi:hypothetical protein